LREALSPDTKLSGLVGGGAPSRNANSATIEALRTQSRTQARAYSSFARRMLKRLLKKLFTSFFFIFGEKNFLLFRNSFLNVRRIRPVESWDFQKFYFWNRLKVNFV
jgi:hypothetical protein